MAGASRLQNNRDVDAASVQSQLGRILASPAFRATPRRRHFLRYVIEQEAAGRVGNLKGYAIAVTVYGRDASFDPRIDPLVRIEAARLRSELDAYYRADGQDDPILIEIPKGGNAPKFTLRVPSPETTDKLAETRPVLSDETAPPPPRRLPNRLVAAGLAGSVVLALSIGAFLFKRSEEARMSSGKLASVAVLPFVAEDGGETYFAIGLSQELAMRLFQFPSLTVTPPSSINRASLRETSDMRRAIGTKVYVEGTVYKGPNSLRVTARLINTANGTLLWAGTFDRPVEAGKILDIQDEIAARIASQLGANLGVIAREALETTLAKRPSSMDALACVLQVHHHQIRLDSRSHATVRECLETTIVREPAYAEAWASLALIYAQEYRLGFNPRSEGKPARQRAQEAAERALMLSPSNPNVMMIRATTMYDNGDMAGFEKLSRAAIKAGPGEPDLYAHYGLRVAFSGEWQRGAALLMQAIEMNPQQHPEWYKYPLIMADYLAGEFDSALKRSADLVPMRFITSDFFAAMIHGKAGNSALAQAAAARVMRDTPSVQQNFFTLFRAWRLPEDDIARFAEGLIKAGITLKDNDRPKSQ
jgi:TolB-like protein/Tfp pilus assembly protein PilF